MIFQDSVRIAEHAIYLADSTRIANNAIHIHNNVAVATGDIPNVLGNALLMGAFIALVIGVGIASIKILKR